ncbi:Outer membrane lipoprotein-sorting protein [hydrothermal vent metagenome]|uniref:Outer membrane lipoprotein-sorting protein n=1 Tax=hydrothermal vent metagenome TaxID=652676 RepID=A0A3B0S4X8_9ZZZZ
MCSLFRRIYLSLLIAGFVSLSAAYAETPEEKGLAIAQEVDRRDEGFQDTVAVLQMILSNRQGRESRRKLKIKTFEMTDPDVGDKSLVIFDSPRDVKGTAFLTHSNILDPDDQWIYLPALGRIKRISSSNKSGPFMGSEFAYEDMSSREVGKYHYKWLRDEPCGTLTCFVVEAYPQYAKSGYTKLVSWIDTQEYRTMKIEFYNRRGELFKILTPSDYKLYLNKYWRAGKLYMENVMTGKKTWLIWSRYDFRTGLKEQNFSKSRLKTAK